MRMIKDKESMGAALVTACACILLCLLPFSIQAERVLKVGVDCCVPPFSFIDTGSNTIRGFNIDLAKMVAASSKAKVRFIPADSAELGRLLSAGRVDLIIGDRIGAGDFQFLELPIQTDRKLFVNLSSVSITCVRDLPGRTVVVQKGSALTSLIPDLGKVKVIEADTEERAIQMVSDGQAEAYLSPNALATVYLIQKHHLTNVKAVGLPVESVPMAISVLQDNTALLTELSVAFGKIVENKSYETIHSKWFGRDIPFANLERYVRIGAIGGGMFALVLLGFVIWTRTLKRRVRQVTSDLQLSEQKHKDLIEFSPEMIYLISPDCRIVHANNIGLQTLAYTVSEIGSLKIYDIVPPENRWEMESFIRTVFETGGGVREFSLLTKQGKKIEVEMSAAIIKGVDSDLACCFSRDITERKRLEEELIQSERLAIMGEMAAGIAHEINNPLGIILANTEELLQLQLCQESAKEGLEAIERNAVRAGKFIDDLLTFTRPRPPAHAPIDLSSLVEESLSLCKQQLRQKGIRVEKAFPAEPVMFEGDDNQMQQVFVNLILNSIQAISDKGTIRIQVSRERQNGSQNVCLRIADTGMGIPEKDLPKIFNPFYTARKNKGFGLGLSISKRIIEKHNGSVRVESKMGEGTTIFIDLPLGESSTEPMKEAGVETRKHG